MATFTTHYSLRKPAGSDFVSVSVDIASSMETIDDALHDHDLELVAVDGRLDDLEAALVKAKMRKTADQSINDSTNTLIQWAVDTESNPAGFANQANDRFVVPITGDYLVDIQVPWATDVDGRRDIQIQVNAVDRKLLRMLSHGGGGIVTYQNHCCKLNLTSGDLVTFVANHNAGAALVITGGATNGNTDCFVTMTYLGT